MQKDDKELDEAVGKDEDTDGPESDVKAVTRESAPVEPEDGEFDLRYAGVVEFLDHEGDLWVGSSSQSAFLVLRIAIPYFCDCHRALEGDYMFGTTVRYGTDHNRKTS